MLKIVKFQYIFNHFYNILNIIENQILYTNEVLKDRRLNKLTKI